MTEKSSKKPLVIVVAGALVDADGRVLITRRPNGKEMAGLWEFPGGKVEKGEDPETAIVREIREELSIHIQPSTKLSSFDHPTDRGTTIRFIPIICTWIGEKLNLNEHTDARWIHESQFDDHEFASPDYPVIKDLKRYLMKDNRTGQ